MKSISVTDLKLIPELSHLRMIDFINPANDMLIAPYLKMLGFDLDYPIEYVPSQHRNLQGDVVIAYRIVGDVECNDSFLSGPFATAEDRMMSRGYQDISLANDMAKHLTSGRDYGEEGHSEKGFPPELVMENEQVVLDQIQVLKELLIAVRGNPFKQDGSRKTIYEHGIEEPPEKVRKKPVKK